jgi:hypothetical protein
MGRTVCEIHWLMHASDGVGSCPEAGNVAGRVWLIPKFDMCAFQVCSICHIYSDRATVLSTIRQPHMTPMTPVYCCPCTPQPCTPTMPAGTGSNHTGH